MSRATPDDQLKFLLNCVKHSNNGKVGRVMFSFTDDIETEAEQIDFIEVAKECGIVSKGAAYAVTPSQFLLSGKLMIAIAERNDMSD
jgi:hypothetical protein